MKYILSFMLPFLLSESFCLYGQEKPGDSLNVDYPLFLHFDAPPVNTGYPEIIDSTRELYLYLDNSYQSIAKGILGNRLFLINNSSDDLTFDSIDSEIYIHAEAMFDGIWLPVSSILGSDCGLSYHKIKMRNNAIWNFYIPCFKGSFETQIRYVLMNRSFERQLVSNAIPARIHPQQFNVLNINDDYLIFPSKK